MIAEDNADICETRQRLCEVEKQQNKLEGFSTEREKAAEEVQDLRTRLERVQAEINALQDRAGSNLESKTELQRLQQLKKNCQTDLENGKRQILALQKQVKNLEKKCAGADKLKVNLSVQEKVRKILHERLNTTKSLEDLNERAAELEHETVEDRVIIADENTSPSERADAEERVAGRDEELASLRTQIEVRERVMPLRERIKEIFKKYGVTVTAIYLVAGLAIGAVIGSITNSLKATSKALGNGLKEIGKKNSFTSA